MASLERLRSTLQERTGLKEFGMIMTDSRSGPLRLGVVGVSLAFAGFHPVRNQVGDLDLFGRPLKITKVNLVDSLAAAAVLMMGEANEQCPLAMICNAPLDFTESWNRADLEVRSSEDMYLPLYQHLMK